MTLVSEEQSTIIEFEVEKSRKSNN